MDMSYMNAALQSLQTCVSTFALSKAMGKDAQSMAMMLDDLAMATPQLAPKAGSMDILV